MTRNNGNNHRQVTIAFDTWTLASRFRNTGIHVYASKLLSHFREIAPQHSVEFRPLVSSALPNDANAFEPSTGFRPHETNLLKLDRGWRFGGACISAFMSNADLLFCPSGTTLPVNPLMPIVSTIHDVTPVVFPAFPKRIARALRFAFANSAKFSRSIITDSMCSKNDIIHAYGVPESKIHVVYLGFDTAIFNEEPDPQRQTAVQQRLGLSRPYLLHHGTIQPRKNLGRLIEAYRNMLSRNPNLEFDLVLVGNLGWQYEEIVASANRSSPGGRVVLAGPQADADLAALLKGAALVVVPSLYEGFCLPLVEAMACGVPSICSNASCLPEVSGGVLDYFDPLSAEEMSACMERTLESRDRLKGLSNRGKERASQFGWERCAAETLQILKTAALN